MEDRSLLQLSRCQIRLPYRITIFDFNDGAFNQWAQQYLPELYEQEVERYGNRNIIWFLKNGRCRDADDIRSSSLV